MINGNYRHEVSCQAIVRKILFFFSRTCQNTNIPKIGSRDHVSQDSISFMLP